MHASTGFTVENGIDFPPTRTCTSKLFVASALLIAPFVYEATGLQIGTHDVVSSEDMPRYDSEVGLANAGRLLVVASTTQPNFANARPVDSAVFLHHVSDVLQTANRTALEQNFIQSDDDTSRARLKSAGGGRCAVVGVSSHLTPSLLRRR